MDEQSTSFGASSVIHFVYSKQQITHFIRWKTISTHETNALKCCYNFKLDANLIRFRLVQLNRSWNVYARVVVGERKKNDRPHKNEIVYSFRDGHKQALKKQQMITANQALRSRSFIQ